MAIQFRLAALGHTMETGRVVEWHIAEGGKIEEGELLISIETDKAVADIESPVSGVLLRIVGQVDGVYDVGATLAWIGEEGEEVPDAPAEQAQTPAAKQAVESRATPVALRLAQRHGIDAEALQGTGPGGRVTKEDVQRAIDDGTATPQKAASEAPAPSPAAQPKEPAAGVEVIPLTGIRRTTAERLGAIWSQAPHVTEGIEVDFTALQAARTANAEAWRNAYGVAPTLNDFVLKATAEALKSYPQLNAALIDDAIHQYSDVNLGVAIDIESGLVVPVVRKVDTLGVIALAGRVRELADRARNGKLGFDDFADGTFTVTNLGGLGVDWFTPVLNPPQCAILGVGRVREAAVVADRSIQFRDVATLVLTFDHRAIDGAPCARFLGDLRARIEDPSQLLP
jgi:pyruvate dehydrogenase E2 component (dihydrolipoamide acetyltransferase)